jgi:predicted SAM-dependent methyltransferase
MNLNLGGKNTRIKGYKTIDIYDGKNVDIVSDISDLKFAKDLSVDKIYASHCLEHFPRTRTLEVLKEWNRVLKVGGTLYLAVPDFDAIIDFYKKIGMMSEVVIGLLYGNQNEPYNFHYITFTYSNICYALNKAGFRDFKRVDSFGILNDCSTIKDSLFGKNLSLNVVAIK